MLQKNKRNICYISVPVAPPESISKHRLWWFEVLTLTGKKLTIFKYAPKEQAQHLLQFCASSLLNRFLSIVYGGLKF